MAIETKPKRLHYRKAVFLGGKAQNLQNLLIAALNKLAQVQLRRQPTSPGSSEYRLINDHTVQVAMIFGDFFTYEAGVNKLQVAVDPTAPALDVQKVAPKQTHPHKRSEFLDNLLFFACFNNHVVLMQSHAWQGKTFENYLNWLLNQAGLLAAGNRIELSDVPPPSIRNRAVSSDIKAISFRAPVVEIGDGDELSDAVSGISQSIVAERKMGAELIRTILGNDEFEKLHLDKAAGGNLRVNMKITFDRSTTHGGQRALNGIARALRHTDLEDDDVRLDIPGVGSVKGSELKLTHIVNVQTNDGIVQPDQMFPLMAQWVHDLVKNKLID